MLSYASAELIALEISRLEGVSGVSVNPRTGSVIATFDSVGGRSRLTAYLAGLESNPPVRRSERRRMAPVPARRPSDPAELLRSAVPSKAAQAIEVMRESRFVQELSRAVRSGAENMPILTSIVRPIAAFFGAGGSAGPVRRSSARAASWRFGAIPLRSPAPNSISVLSPASSC